MTDSNRVTLESYEQRLGEYIARTPGELDPNLREFIDSSFAAVAPGATVLELGAGFGRDALYLQKKGFAVIPTDGAASFVEELQRRGLPAYRLNLLEDEFPETAAIYANAVFLHLTRDELVATLQKARQALSPGGRLIFTLKAGDGEHWTSAKLGAPRYFRYWQPEEILPLLIGAGFSSVALDYDPGEAVPWLYLTADAPL